MTAVKKSMHAGVSRVIAARGVTLATSFVFSVLTVRLIVTNFGPDVFAAVALVATLVSVIPFADLGLGIALSNLASEHMKGLHTDRIGPAVRAVLLTLLGIGIAVAAFLVIVVNVAGLAQNSVLSRIGDPSIYLSLYALLFVLWLLGGVANRLLMGMGRASTLMLLAAGAPPLTYLLSWAVTVTSAPIWTLALVPICAAIFVSALAWAVSWRSLRQLQSVTRAKLQPGDYASLLKQGLSGALMGVGTVLLLQTDRLLTAGVGSRHDLVLIALVLPPFAAVQSLLGAAGSFLWPHYYGLVLDGRMTLAVLRRHMMFAGAAGFGLALALAGLLPLYLSVVGYEGAVPWGIVLALSLFVVGQSLTLVLSSYLTSPEMIRRQGMTSLGAGVLKVVLALLAIPVFGAAGAVMASALVVLALQLPMYWTFTSRSFNRAGALG